MSFIQSINESFLKDDITKFLRAGTITSAAVGSDSDIAI
jgi:hypothetical protein